SCFHALLPPLSPLFPYTTLFRSVFAASFVLAGRLQDKVGPFRISLVGAVFLSLGLVLASRTDSLMWIYVTLGGIMGFGNGFGYADRKSTRLNSSHEWISYAVFCL